MNERRYLPWLIAAVLPVITILWMRDDNPPPAQPEPVSARTESPIPDGLELVPPPATRAPAPSAPYPAWPDAPRAGTFAPREPAPETWRFRPLSERERHRFEQQSGGYYGAPAPYAPPRYEEPRRPYEPAQAPRGYGMDPMTPEPWQQGWGNEGYSFRPQAPSTRSRGRWQGPYSAPLPNRPALRDAPPIFDQENQWGATPRRSPPPSHRMYPSLDQRGNRRLTAL